MIERKWRNDETISASVNATRLSLSDDSVSYDDIESFELHLRRKRKKQKRKKKRKRRKNRQDGDLWSVKPRTLRSFDLFENRRGNLRDGGRKGRVDTGMQGRTKRKVGWKPLEIESIKPRATPPSPSLHRWLDRSKDSPPKMEEINVQSFSIRIDFRWNKIWYDLKNLNWELFTREARWSTRFRELKLILREFKWIRDYNDNDFVYFNKLYH